MNPSLPTLSIIIPAYNEEATLYTLLEKVYEAGLPEGVNKEIIVINDASSDGTAGELDRFRSEYDPSRLQYFEQPINEGKGAAIHMGIELAKGDYLIVQDADLEYDPQEFSRLIQPALDGFADVVYGSRFMGGYAHRMLFFWHSIGNQVLTTLSNMLCNLNLSDMETCYKLIRADIAKSLNLKEKRFGFEPEVTAKLSRVPKIRIYEVGISYYGRTYEEGKKIGWRDGFRTIYCILKYNLWAKN